METALAGLVVLVLLLVLVLGALALSIYRGLQGGASYLRELLDAARLRIAELERQVDSLHAQGLRTEPAAPTGLGEDLDVELPKEVEADLAAIEDDDAREEFRELARARLARNPAIPSKQLLAELYGEHETDGVTAD